MHLLFFQSFIGHSSAVSSILLTPDNSTVVSVGDSIIYWDFLAYSTVEQKEAMNKQMLKGRALENMRDQPVAIIRETKDVVKCFNTTGANNMQNPNYGETSLDLFVAGDSEKGKEAAIQLALDAGFENCYSIGGNDKFELMEQFAWFWINLAMFQGQGREIGFKLLKRL